MIKGRSWTKQEEHSFISDYSEMNKNDLIIKYDRTWIAIRQRAMLLGIKRDREQSYDIKITDLSGNVIHEHHVNKNAASFPTKKNMIIRFLALNKMAIDRGEWILSITHNLECFTNE